MARPSVPNMNSPLASAWPRTVHHEAVLDAVDELVQLHPGAMKVFRIRIRGSSSYSHARAFPVGATPWRWAVWRSWR